MKKFEDELQKAFNEMPMFASFEKSRAVFMRHFKDWVTPEDYATGIVKWKHENQRLRTLLDAAAESSKELLDINKKIRGDLGDAQGKLRGSEDYIKELKSQLEKQQPEIPEFVAEDIKRLHSYVKSGKNHHIFDISYYTDKSINWIEYDYENYQKFYLAVSTGNFTVAKEKRFYLKHKSVLVFDPDSDDSDVDELYLGAGGNFVPYQHLAYKFTQQEIDNMETGSYEQIEAEEK